MIGRLTSRRHFIAGGVGLVTVGVVSPPGVKASVQERPPPLPPDQVFEFVRAAHSDLERTREMLADEPNLLNATWDWGGGDFETALGGASHMGDRGIAAFLLGQGARLDLFCAAAMGLIEVVRSVVDVYPDAARWTGPHGIPLIRHAERGEAPEVVDFLRTRGA